MDFGRQTGDWKMSLLPMNLRLKATDGSGIDEYRISEGTIEVRRVQRSGEPASDDEWRVLTHRELADHVKHGTVVAQWLRKRIGWRRLLQACVDPQTLEEFGIPENTLDRYAA
jgi:hypothetical protein